MKPNHTRVRTALAVTAAALAVLAAACGGPASSGSAVQGAVVAEAPVAAAITLKDSSTPPRVARTSADGAGSYRLDVSGMTPPFVLRAEWGDGSGRMHTVAPGSGAADINPLTEVAVAGASRHEDSGEAYDDDDAEEHHRTERRFPEFLAQLRTVLAPLFDLYGIGADPLADRARLRALLRDVRFAASRGVITVTNRATGGVIFTGPLADLASGTFHPENLPGGPGTPPPPPPPPTDGAALYQASCMSCHGPLATSEKRGATAGAIQGAIDGNTGGMGSAALRALTPAQVAAIAGALASTGPGACTYTYSDWSACGAGGTQTRTVVSATPAGCTGTPVLSQQCTPPIDGAALYAAHCAGCHGNGRKGSSASTIQRAIDNDVGGMGTAALRALTPAQIAAIAAAP